MDWPLRPAGAAVADRIGLQPGHDRVPFWILDYTGQPMTSLVEQHERPVHLIVVRRDQSGSQHPHPTVQIDGTWMVGMTYPQRVYGVRRAFADFAQGRHYPAPITCRTVRP